VKRYYGTRLYHRTICSQRLTKSKPVDARSKEQTLVGLLTKEADRSWLFAKKHNKSLWSCAWFVWYVTISTQKMRKKLERHEAFSSGPSHLQGKSYNHPNTLRGKNITLCKLLKAESPKKEREKGKGSKNPSRFALSRFFVPFPNNCV
jgi:hypothetical protein